MRILIYNWATSLTPVTANIFSVHGFDGLAFGVHRDKSGWWRVTEVSSGFAAGRGFATSESAVTGTAMELNYLGEKTVRKSIDYARETVSHVLGVGAIEALDNANTRALELLNGH